MRIEEIKNLNNAQIRNIKIEPLDKIPRNFLRDFHKQPRRGELTRPALRSNPLRSNPRPPLPFASANPCFSPFQPP